MIFGLFSDIAYWSDKIEVMEVLQADGCSITFNEAGVFFANFAGSCSFPDVILFFTVFSCLAPLDVAIDDWTLSLEGFFAIFD